MHDRESTTARSPLATRYHEACLRAPVLGPFRVPAMSDKPILLPQPVREAAPDTDAGLDRGWNVIVWDDPINLMDYVVFVFRTLFGMPETLAVRHMLEVHNTGKSLVATEDRERAEFYVARLHRYGLQATLQRAG